MGVPTIIVGLVLFTISMTIVDVVFGRRLLPRTRVGQLRIWHLGVTVLAFLALTLAALAVAAR